MFRSKEKYSLGMTPIDIKQHLLERMISSGAVNFDELGEAAECSNETEKKSLPQSDHSDIPWSEHGIRVLFRLRPLRPSEISLGTAMLHSNHSIRVSRQNKTHEFKYHGVIGQNASQQESVSRCSAGVLDHLLAGYNTAILTYGQTGSGKSHTVIGVQHSSSITRLIQKIESVTKYSNVFPEEPWYATASNVVEPGQSVEVVTIFIVTSVKNVCKRIPEVHATFKLSTSFVTPQQAALLFGVVKFIQSNPRESSFLHSCLAHVPPAQIELLGMFLKVISRNRFIPYDAKDCEADHGILPSVATQIFERIDQSNTKVHLSAVQVHSEEVTDLLHNKDGETPKKQRLLSDPEKGVWLPDATEVVCQSAKCLLSHFGIAITKRIVGSTHSNFVSSRSHAIFIITLSTHTPHFSNSSQLYCVDLAGSERADNSFASRQEGSHINKSLLALRKMITAISSGKSKTLENAKQPTVSCRESKLTRLLQNCIGGNSRTAIVVTGSNSVAHANETFSSLQFGSVATKVVNSSKIVVTHNIKDLLKAVHQQADEIAFLRSENADLKSKIHQLSPLSIDIDTDALPPINKMGTNPLYIIFSFLCSNDFATLGFVCSLWLSITEERDEWSQQGITRDIYVANHYITPVAPPSPKVEVVKSRYMKDYNPTVPSGLRLSVP